MDPNAILEGLRNETLDRSEVTDPTLLAVIELADWLAFPTELDRYPDSIRILDSRRMYWPPVREEIPLWLLEFTVQDEYGLSPDIVGIGLVGSVTFCLSTYENHRRPHDDVYAIHCYWELQQSGALTESQEAVVLSSGAEGWLVCDGPETTWYPASQMPSEAPPKTVLMVHVGRMLLGMPTHGIVRSVPESVPELPDDLFLERYERLLDSSEEEQEELFDSWGPLGSHAERYLKLIDPKRPADARSFLLKISEFWQHSSGYSEIGRMAYEMGMPDLTIQFLERLKESYPHYYRSETMGLLARTYTQTGRRQEGVDLLIDCLALLDKDAESAKGSDVDLFASRRKAHVEALESIS
ncbi:MAG TPA: tetratricopeptide repeat protein [Thermoanaerobaculia bacterium]|nr:tetratricopeptide repeat protein [Thermoanaerobaculia bacterium]